MIYKKHPLIVYTWAGLLILFLMITYNTTAETQTTLLVIDVLLWFTVFKTYFEQVELTEDRIKYRKIKFIFPHTYEIPYNKVNDVSMSTYLPWFSVVKIKTGNNDNTKLSFFKKAGEIKEFVFEKMK